jgi:transforming growth factor-beta-induced protein
MRSLLRWFIVPLALLALIAAGCGDDDDDDTAEDSAATDEEMAEEEEMGDVLEVAAAEGDLGTFLDATEAAGIMDGLHGEGPFTVFAPTDDAFAAYLDQSGMTQDEVFGDMAMAESIIGYHIVNMSEMADQVMAMDGQTLMTSSGQELPITVEGETVMVGNATVERYDIEASNGVIHVIDGVLVPPEA